MYQQGQVCDVKSSQASNHCVGFLLSIKEASSSRHFWLLLHFPAMELCTQTNPSFSKPLTNLLWFYHSNRKVTETGFTLVFV